MIGFICNPNQWPVDDYGAPVLNSTSDAVLYAHIIQSFQWRQFQLDHLISKFDDDFNELIGSKDPDLDKLAQLAFRIQFYRECIEEVKMITKED